MNATSSPIPEPPRASAMLDRVRSEAAELRSFTITFLSLLLYVAIIISSTTHEQILRVDPVKLPLLGVDIPIVGFYWFMPGFLFFLHMYLLLQHYLFSQLAFRFYAALERETDQETKNHLRRSLGNLPFLHWLVGQHGGFMNFLMTAITVVSLIIWPVLTFWCLQAAFLPYHDNDIVWTQRTFLLLDAALLAYLWAKTLDDQDDAGRWWKPWLAPFFYGLAKPIRAMVRWAIDWLSLQPRLTAWVRNICPRGIFDWLQLWLGDATSTPTPPSNLVTLAAVLDRWLLALFLLSMLFLSFIVSTIPHSPEEEWLLNSWITMSGEKGNRRILPSTFFLHEQRRSKMDDDELNDYDRERILESREKSVSDKQAGAAGAQTANDESRAKPESQRKYYWIDSPFPRNLILREKLLVANKGLAAEVQTGLSAAVGTTKADDLAKAEGLSLQGRHLEYADFSQSSLPNADLRRARLKAAKLFGAKLEKAHLEQAILSGANLSWAKLPGADLSEAKLTGAYLSEAQFAGANLSEAQLTGVYLSKAQLPGANLSGAQLIGANLSEAQLIGANLSGAQITGAILNGAQLTGVILEKINLAPMNKEEANAEADKLYSVLKDLPQYRGDSGKSALVKEKKKFYKMITSSIDFSKLAASEGCLADESVLNVLSICKKIGDLKTQKKTYETWVNMACHDDTEKHWVAQRMIVRAEDPRFPHFAPLLAAKLQASDECLSLDDLDVAWKKRLLKAKNKAYEK